MNRLLVLRHRPSPFSPLADRNRRCRVYLRTLVPVRSPTTESRESSLVLDLSRRMERAGGTRSPPFRRTLSRRALVSPRLRPSPAPESNHGRSGCVFTVEDGVKGELGERVVRVRPPCTTTHSQTTSGGKIHWKQKRQLNLRQGRVREEEQTGNVLLGENPRRDVRRNSTPPRRRVEEKGDY